MRRRASAAPAGEPEKPRAAPRHAQKPRFPKPDATKAARPTKGKKPPQAVTGDAGEKAFAGERIAKAMARAGVCSRREAEQWIMEGRVSVNGRALTSPAFNVRAGDKIAVDGRPLAERERTRLFLFHKPAGLVTSAKDPEGRETVFAYLAERHPDLPRLVSVGRLDINTEGLLLLTNDGGLARVLELPATGWTRRYRVRAHGDVDQAKLDTLAEGVTVDEVNYAPIEARLDRVQGANAWITMSLSEGKNREIKRVLEYLGLDVNRLIRVSFGPFQLGDLAEGAVEEVRLKVLREQLGKGLAELAGVDFSSPLREAPSATEAQEARQRAESRPRKHVSALRKQRAERDDEKPRARIERAVTADRKGRAVAVERVVLKGERPAAETRNARRFDALHRRDDKQARFGGKGEAAGEERARSGGPRVRTAPPRAEDGGRSSPGRFAPRREHDNKSPRPFRGGDERKGAGGPARDEDRGRTASSRFAGRREEDKKSPRPFRSGDEHKRGGGPARGPAKPHGKPPGRPPRRPK